MSSPPLNNTQGQEGNLSSTYQPDSLHNSDNSQPQALPQPYQSQPQRAFRAPRICCCELRTGLMAMALCEIAYYGIALIVFGIFSNKNANDILSLAVMKVSDSDRDTYIPLGFNIAELLAAVALFVFTFLSIKKGCVGSHAIQWILFVSQFVVSIILALKASDDTSMAVSITVISYVFLLLFRLYGCAIVYYFYKETTNYNANPPSNIYGGNTTGGYGNINNPPPYYGGYVQPGYGQPNYGTNDTSIQYGQSGYSQPYYNGQTQVPPPQY